MAPLHMKSVFNIRVHGQVEQSRYPVTPHMNITTGGLKVKALGQTLRDAGSSPAWHSSFPASKLL